MIDTDDRYDVPPCQITCEQAQQMAIEITVATHLVGCALVLVYWACVGDGSLLAVWASILLVTFVIPMVLASLVGFTIYQLFHRTTLPMALFVRTCALVFEISLFAWLALFLINIHPNDWRY